MNDITIRNVQILDGLGGEAYPGDVGISDGRISDVGSAEPGKEEVDGKGQYLAPGFIDTHSHDDGAFFRHPGMAFKLAQGVTTVVAGNCGFSAVPIDPSVDPGRASGGILAGLEGSFTDLEGYFEAALEKGPGINNMMLDTAGSCSFAERRIAKSKSKPECISSLLLVEAVDFARLRLFLKEVMRFLGWLILIDLEE